MWHILFATLISIVAAQGGYGPGYGSDYGTTSSTAGAPTATAAGGTGGSGSGGGGGNSQPASGAFLLPPKHIIIAHVVCGALATMLFLPLGVLIPRYARGFTTRRWWWSAHSAVMGILAFAFAVAAMAIVRTKLRGTYNSLHAKLALATLCLISFQILLGIFVHYVKTGVDRFKVKGAGGRGPSNFLHIVTGWATVAMGFATAWQGLTFWWPLVSGTGEASMGYIAAWAIIVGFTGVAYLGGLLLLPRQLRLAKEAQETRATGVAPEDGGIAEAKQKAPLRVEAQPH